MYEDQAGRASSIEDHIAILKEKRKPKTMTELYDNLTAEQMMEIRTNWGTTLENLKMLAIKHDARKAKDDQLPEDVRTRQGTRMLN